MNERIKELAEQCTDCVYGEDGGYEMFDKEKFAELIVRECAQFCEEKNSKLLGTMLKEHFGVEE
jgi:hypothetical protein